MEGKRPSVSSYRINTRAREKGLLFEKGILGEQPLTKKRQFKRRRDVQKGL